VDGTLAGFEKKYINVIVKYINVIVIVIDYSNFNL
jgi:hypothetical protein